MKNSVVIHKTAKPALIKTAQLYRYCIPFSEPMCFGDNTITEREGFIVALVFDDDSMGYGEAAPLKGFSRESLFECEQQLHCGLKQLVDKGFTTISPSAALFALDCAINKTPFQFKTTSTDNTPLLLGDTSTIIKKYQALNCPNKVKLKVGRNSIAEDIKRINALLNINNTLTLQLDANRAWSVEEAMKFSISTDKHAINYIEEPCHSLSESLQFSQITGIGIALDESLHDKEFVFTPQEAIKALVIKPTIIGSFERCKELIIQARRAKITTYLSSSYESSLGISQLQYLAKVWTPNQSSGFDTLDPLTLDIINDSGRDVAVLKINDLELLCQY